MIGGLYERALAGYGPVEIEHANGDRSPLPVELWQVGRPGDETLLGHCSGPTLDIGSGPGRLTVALAERGVPALGIDVTPHAVAMTCAAGGMALERDVFHRVPGTGRWATVLLADGNIGIGGHPVVLLRRVADLLGADGQALVELEPPGDTTRTESVRLRSARHIGEWFRWAYVGADSIAGHAAEAGLAVIHSWTEADRWFAALARA
jgi:SAM-dependent methyltransferase